MTARWDRLPLEYEGKVVRRARRKLTGAGIFRCHACGHEATAWAKAERHADENGHVRIECVAAKQ